MKLLALGVISVILGVSSARTVRQSQRAHFLGDGSNDVAVNILQDIIGKEKNAVFSPLGYTTILAILTEGARENTRNQLVASLKLPEDTYAVRSTYKRVLTEMTAHDTLNKPEFKNWFYVYKNYTVEESYRNVLKENYLTEVKEVDRYEFPDEEEAENEKPSELESTTQNSQEKAVESIKDVSQVDSLQKVEADDSKEDESTEKSGSKDKGSSEEKDSKEKDSAEDKDSSEEKTQNVKKPSNVMKIKEKVKPVDSKDKSSASPMIEKEVEDKEPPSESSDGQKESVDVQMEVTTQSDEEAGKQQSTSSYPRIDVRSARDTAALSANKLSTMDAERESSLKKLSRMMVFNALYFKGNWSKRFIAKTEKYPFKVSKTEEKSVEYLQAEDEFETGRIPELDAQALDIPYQGERYSVLILVPTGEDGLEGLLKKMPGFSFYNIDKHLTKLPTKVCIPKLKFYTISRPKDAFIKSGISDIFNQNADLSGISEKGGLFLEELVQLVTFELDETDSSFNYLTTSDVTELRSTTVSFRANQPFIFFLRDKVENLNIVSGIVTDPSMPPEGKLNQASEVKN